MHRIDEVAELYGCMGDTAMQWSPHIIVTPSPCAVDATVHDSLDKRADVLVIHCPLTLHKPTPITAKHHGLILKITFASLVADRAIEGMIDLRDEK